jgi:4-hydroxybenzoate polyprenyltransferase
VLYSWPIWPWRGRARALREVPLLKGFLIATVWTAVTVGLPVLLLQQPAAAAAGLFGQRFCLIMVITIVFDIRDYGRDRRAGTRTFPGVLGVPMAKRLALGFLVVSMALGLARGAPPLAVLLPGLLSAGVVSAAEESRGDYFYALLTDGLLVVQGLAYFVF